ncbi:hypothetical protein NQ318_012073 [Aromia moschata]|uniref:Tr-type G domain-containing protein n=1 Tax=Aromia moschata TaxID=1265417 RepID=A0AAV8Y2Q7_9CUCU|nr:hypothetical protein NQ318_012073 [Aromia moschata]
MIAIIKLKKVFSKSSHFLKGNCYSTIKTIKNVEIEKIRNIGILAHIDAGKTTTTERMLYYAGLINEMGEVHHGNTVTDYMDQERERGITITSAAVTFRWRQNQINLIDTPGHIDFTMEVEQTLNVLDGAVVILDGSAGVEAQTQTVWRQADRYKLPRIVFVNKMDRLDADIKMCCESVENKLETPYLLLQLPIRENGQFVGIIDILSMEMLNFGKAKDKQVQRTRLTEDKFPKHWTEAALARSELIDKLTEHNDELANTVITSESLENIATDDIVRALNAVTHSQTAAPVLLGSSYKNIGVQSLMDAVVLYLPSPVHKNQQYKCFEENLCAKAFKVIHDDQKGPLVFFRLYNGLLKSYVWRYGDQFAFCLPEGQKEHCTVIKKSNVEEANLDKALGTGITVPEPVFFCSIEPPSLASQGALEQALVELQREDPSLRVSYDAETGQTVLAGMGELHLEIIRDRILKEYKIEADLGPLQIAYRESPTTAVTDSLTVETRIGNSKQCITVKMSVVPTDSKQSTNDALKLDKSPESASNIASIFPKHLLAVRQGVDVGLSHGPKISSQVVNAHVVLHMLEVGRGTSETMMAAAATQLVQKLLRESGTDILEPVMRLEVVAPEEHLSTVLADLSRRRSTILDVTVRGKSKVVLAHVPLSELLGYSTILRTLTSGTSTFSMEFGQYEKMSPTDELTAIRNVRGF